MTLEALASWSSVHDLVGKRPDRRWGRACLSNRRYDGWSTARWFSHHTPVERVDLVRTALLDREPWSPLLRTMIPKKTGSGALRAVDMPTVLDQARLYLLHDWLAVHAERVLTRVAVGFRRGVQMHQTVLDAHRALTRRPWVSVVDIAGFFNSIGWRLVDRVIDALPADHDVHSLLKDLVRITVVERRSGAVLERCKGITQGLSVSPLLANLVLDGLDRGAGQALSKSGVLMRRYCDDIALLAPSEAVGQRALDIVRDRLAALGLAVKVGTGQLVDTRQGSAVWLGIGFEQGGLHVPRPTVLAKAAQLQAKLEHGILDRQGVEHALTSLDQYYRRIIGPEAAQEVIASIRGKLDLSAIPRRRKEGIALLKELVGERHHHGPLTQGAWPHGLPDDDGGNDRGYPNSTAREDPGTAGIAPNCDA